MRRRLPTLLASVLVLCLTAAWVLAKGHHGEGWHGNGQGKWGHDDRGPGAAVVTTNDLYAARCGGCHFAYPPQLLPAGSWKLLLGATSDHFGQDLALNDADKAGLLDFTTANAADRSPLKSSHKIMGCLGGATPMRLTDVPYIQRKHRRLDPAVLARASIGSLANCAACHPGAAACRFDDDNVTIPPH